MKEIIAFHQLNDYSGSPKVLANLLSGLAQNGYSITLYTSSGGILDKVPGIKRRNVSYSFSNFFIYSLFNFFKSNIQYFIRSLTERKGNKVIYINTILPFGAALGAKLRGHKIIYHCHENILNKGSFYKFLGGIMAKTADKIICVSKHQQQSLPCIDKSVIIPNALSTEFYNINPDINKAFEAKTILMLSSLKKYKGIDEFWKLANELPQYKFILVINDRLENIENYFSQNKLPSLGNLEVYPSQENVVQFYQRASIVLNLSHKNLFIETFGLTAIEALASGKPTIVPTMGGIAEIVENDFNGYKIDFNHIEEIKKKIIDLLSSREMYSRIANNSLSLKSKYSKQEIVNRVIKVIEEV